MVFDINKPLSESTQMRCKYHMSSAVNIEAQTLNVQTRPINHHMRDRSVFVWTCDSKHAVKLNQFQNVYTIQNTNLLDLTMWVKSQRATDVSQYTMSLWLM